MRAMLGNRFVFGDAAGTRPQRHRRPPASTGPRGLAIHGVEHPRRDALDEVVAAADAPKPVVVKPHLVAALDPRDGVEKPGLVDARLGEARPRAEIPPPRLRRHPLEFLEHQPGDRQPGVRPRPTPRIDHAHDPVHPSASYALPPGVPSQPVPHATATPSVATTIAALYGTRHQPKVVRSDRRVAADPSKRRFPRAPCTSGKRCR
jgi:hypothetical protein